MCLRLKRQEINLMILSHWKFIPTFPIWKRDIFNCSKIYDYEFMSSQFVILFLTIAQYVPVFVSSKIKKTEHIKEVWNSAV